MTQIIRKDICVLSGELPPMRELFVLCVWRHPRDSFPEGEDMYGYGDFQTQAAALAWVDEAEFPPNWEVRLRRYRLIDDAQINSPRHGVAVGNLVPREYVFK